MQNHAGRSSYRSVILFVPECSYWKELWRGLAIAVLCLRVSVGVLVLNALKQTSQKVSVTLRGAAVAHPSEVPLRAFDSAHKRTCEEVLHLAKQSSK